jgi:hypothetical protein
VTFFREGHADVLEHRKGTDWSMDMRIQGEPN